MPLAAGDRFGHYEILAPIGAGGMGEVYRARDTKLNREIAIKILPDAFAADADRMARFAREAQVLASLNHPNIAAIYGVEERALIMELVDGPMLSERIAQGPIAVDEAAPIVEQLIDALEYAHEKGVVHRDLKPANIKITPEGRVKVLDFGLAKALAGETTAADPASSPTLTMRATMAGVIMGTAGYMAPEQARGQSVDKRADIWAFGVVVYEMLTGRQLFVGPTVSDTLAAVLKEEPAWELVPEPMRRLVRTCLVKDARRRMRDIGDARLLMNEAPAAQIQATPASSAPIAHRRTWLRLAAEGALALIAIVLAAMWWQATRPIERGMMRFSVDLGPDAVAGVRTTVALSPDGRRIVFPVRSPTGMQLATRVLDQPEATVLPGTEGVNDPFFSPDGQWIGFHADAKLKKISVQGGAAVTLCDAGGYFGAWWGDDGTIVATLDLHNLFRLSAGGGTPKVLAKPEEKGLFTYRWPQILPGGETILVTTADTPADYDNASIGVLTLQSRDLKIVQRGGYDGRYLPSGHLIYVHRGTLFGVPFDLGRLETTGMPAPLVEEVAGNTTFGGGQFDVSRTGTLVYLSGKSGASTRVVMWMDAAGKQTPLLTAAGTATNPRVSPDGTRLALLINAYVFVYDLRRGAMTRLTFGPAGLSRNPVWAPDGRHLVYASQNRDISWTRADGSAQPERILEGKNALPWPMSFSPDGRRLAFTQVGEGSGRDIWILPLDNSNPDHPKPGKPELFLRTPRSDMEPAFSPDGRWLAYASEESGAFHVYVQPSTAGETHGGKWQISTMPGRFPIWSTKSKELFYTTLDGHIMVAEYTATADTFSPGTVRKWCDTPILMTGNNPMNFDLAPDGKRFVVVPAAAPGGAGEKESLHVTFLLNFFDELKRRVPASK
jgi:serine/threonine-protein kinase